MINAANQSKNLNNRISPSKGCILKGDYGFPNRHDKTIINAIQVEGLQYRPSQKDRIE